MSVQLEFHAKPTHLIAGMFGSYVLVGDTVGHVMLADTYFREETATEGWPLPGCRFIHGEQFGR